VRPFTLLALAGCPYLANPPHLDTFGFRDTGFRVDVDSDADMDADADTDADSDADTDTVGPPELEIVDAALHDEAVIVRFMASDADIDTLALDGGPGGMVTWAFPPPGWQNGQGQLERIWPVGCAAIAATLTLTAIDEELLQTQDSTPFDVPFAEIDGPTQAHSLQPPFITCGTHATPADEDCGSWVQSGIAQRIATLTGATGTEMEVRVDGVSLGVTPAPAVQSLALADGNLVQICVRRASSDPVPPEPWRVVVHR
jgi:hypothetical protein